MIKEVWIISGVRTPVGKILGGLSTFTAPQLGSIVIKEAMRRAGIKPDQVDEVIMGQVVQGGSGQAPARQAEIHAGIPGRVPAVTINKICGSGLKAVMLAAQAIQCGDADIVVAGGMESMTNAPFASTQPRFGKKYGDISFSDLMVKDGLWDSFSDMHMGRLAEYTARKSSITREEQDRFAYESHMKAIKAIDSGKFKEEIIPLEVKTRKKTFIVDTDEGPRRDTSLEKLAKLPPAFEKGGTVTAGNSPGLNDGAAAVVVMSAEKAKSLGLEPIGVITAYTSAGAEPKDLFYAPIYAVRNVMDRLGINDINYFDLIELNEAFSAQVLADYKELRWDWSRFNVHGGAVALGHPIGASGARVLVTLLYAMKDRGVSKGLAALCLGGGNAVAMSIER